MDGYRGLSKTATAGTKRLSNLLRSLKWSVLQIDQYLLTEANKEVERLKAQGKRILCIWDGGVLERAESRILEGLAPVLSSKAKRTNRSRKGLLFNAPQIRPIRVMGMEWTGALIAGLEGIPKIAIMSGWTTKGAYATKLRVTFVIRWIKKHIFFDHEGNEKKLWEIGRGKRYLAHKHIRDTTSGLKIACDLWWRPVRHPT